MGFIFNFEGVKNPKLIFIDFEFTKQRSQQESLITTKET